MIQKLLNSQDRGIAPNLERAQKIKDFLKYRRELLRITTDNLRASSWSKRKFQTANIDENATKTRGICCT